MYKDPQTGIEFPATAATFTLGKASDYQGGPGENGIAVRYHSDSAKAEATIFVRRLSPDSQKTASDLLKESLDAIKLLDKVGKYKNVKIYESIETGLEHEWKKGGFTGLLNGSFVMSFIYCHTKNDFAFKIRLTGGDPTRAQEFEPFVKGIQEIINGLKDKP